MMLIVFLLLFLLNGWNWHRCVFVEMLSKDFHPLFPSEDEHRQLKKITDICGELTFSKQTQEGFRIRVDSKIVCTVPSQLKGHLLRMGVPEVAISLALAFLRYEPSERIHPMQAFSHPFFTELPQPARSRDLAKVVDLIRGDVHAGKVIKAYRPADIEDISPRSMPGVMHRPRSVGRDEAVRLVPGASSYSVPLLREKRLPLNPVLSSGEVLGMPTNASQRCVIVPPMGLVPPPMPPPAPPARGQPLSRHPPPPPSAPPSVPPPPPPSALPSVPPPPPPPPSALPSVSPPPVVSEPSEPKDDCERECAQEYEGGETKDESRKRSRESPLSEESPHRKSRKGVEGSNPSDETRRHERRDRGPSSPHRGCLDDGGRRVGEMYRDRGRDRWSDRGRDHWNDRRSDHWSERGRDHWSDRGRDRWSDRSREESRHEGSRKDARSSRG
jgi:hypothetical protein